MRCILFVNFVLDTTRVDVFRMKPLISAKYTLMQESRGAMHAKHEFYVTQTQWVTDKAVEYTLPIRHKCDPVHNRWHALCTQH